jgi:DNA-binding CsgD family transcriptional regulator
MYYLIRYLSRMYDHERVGNAYTEGMAKVLFLVQLIVGLVVLPFWPGSDQRYLAWGLLFLGVVLALPLGTVSAVWGPWAAIRALAEVWTAAPLRPGSAAAAAWSLAAGTFPVAGVLGGLLALIGALQSFDPGVPLAPQLLTLAFFSLVWGLLGLLLGRILHQVSVKLTQTQPRPLLVLTEGFARRFGLTPRECEAAQAVLDGLTYQGAAEAMSVAPATVKSHVLSVYQKTGAGNKIELLRLVEAENLRLHQSVDGVPGAKASI